VDKAVSAAASVPPDPQDFAEGTAFPVQGDLPVPSGLLAHRASPANPAPKETKASRDPRVAGASKDLAERTDFPGHRENPVFRVPPV
jgi:hypothetical protein